MPDPGLRWQQACWPQTHQYRTALDAVANHGIIAGRMNDEQSRRSEIQGRLDRLPVVDRSPFDRAALATALHGLGDTVKILRKADSARKAKIYADMGLELTFDPQTTKSWSLL
ncbi:hypothetical protein ACIBG8_46630 [Nonomuraea sp. NPDC050556]|uniref:hypothetical protein n=1 Tax=Nonomuraea sp. NPDC050556 TaxID=3364369 RepID=UPI0037A2F7EF